MTTDKKSPIPGIISAVFLTVALLMFAIAAFSAVRTGRALAREKVAPGTVVDMAIRQAGDGTLYYRPVVAFTLPDGVPHTLQLAEESTAPAYRADDPVTIAYDPERLESARIRSVSSTASLWILPLITGILGVVFLATTWFVRWVARTGNV